VRRATPAASAMSSMLVSSNPWRLKSVIAVCSELDVRGV
jgi:hypothetical protein